MDLDYFTEDGHCLSKEDYEEFVLWKIDDLKKQGYKDEDIICFDDNRIWKKLAHNEINRNLCIQNQPFTTNQENDELELDF